MRGLSLQRKLKSLFYVTVSGTFAYSVISIYKNNDRFYRNVIMPLVHLLDPEDSHKLAVLVSKYRLIPRSKYVDPDSLKVTLFGREFQNPIGIAAGFDKHAEAVLGLRDIGFGFIEIGSVTPEPQPGNQKPRVFRLSQDLAVINRYGFNSEGHDKVLEHLKKIRKNSDCDRIIGVNLGKNKLSVDAIHDYVTGIKKLGPVADYLVINISSPNTPGLRSMQNKNVLRNLLKSALEARDSLSGRRPPLLLKLAPDLNHSELKDIAQVVREKETKIDGLIISNTTIERPEYLSNKNLSGESGGLSGKPLQDSSTKMIADVYKLTKGEVPIIGVGGIFTGQDAYDKIKAGASIVQIYTSLIYEGPPVVTNIKKQLAFLLAKDGYKHVSEAVGTDLNK